MTAQQWINGNLVPVPTGPGDPGKTVARRYPAHQGYGTRWDIPTPSMSTAKALSLYMEREIGQFTLWLMCSILGAPWPDTLRARADLMAEQMSVTRWLVNIEAFQRCELDRDIRCIHGH